MIVYVLAENTANPGYEAEHGLSLYIKTGNKTILFDMGQTDLFACNAKRLGLDLGEVDVAILSHGHYDHGGGISTFFTKNKKAPLYLSPYAFGDHYNATGNYIGLDKALENNPRLHYAENGTVVAPGAQILSLNPVISPGDIDSAGLTVKTGQCMEREIFLHEQYLLIEEDGKRILLSGCSHKGAYNIASAIKADVFIGGFHYSKMKLDGAELQTAADSLLKLTPTYYTCHCTGVEQYEVLKSKMGERINYISAGDIIEI